MRFQDYKKQGPGFHADADVVRMYEDDAKNLVNRSMDLMKLADSGLKGDDLRKQLREKFYPLAPGAEAGGTDKQFEPRK